MVYRPRLKSGITLRSGLARFIAWPYMFFAYGAKDWAAFAEVYGMPIRIGKYGPGASEDDIRTLINAVVNIGTDAAAVIPQSMQVELESAVNATEGAKLFEALIAYWERAVSKAVLGQTLTTDTTGATGTAAAGTALDWINTAGDWADLAGATVTLIVNGGTLTNAGTVVASAPGTAQHVRVELTAAELAATGLTPRRYEYEVEIVLAGGDEPAYIEGDFTVLRDLS